MSDSMSISQSNSHSDSTSVTFTTSDKQPENVKIVEPTTMKAAMVNSKFFKNKASGEIISSSPDREIVESRSCNGLVSTLVDAYNRHHNVVLRPEHFWVSILTQFSNYVNANSERLRDKFVDFQGQKELIVRGFGTLRTASYESLSVEMTKQISSNLKDDTIRDWVLPNFTTTTDNDRVTCSVVMMASMQKYFTYKFTLCCGIPQVTLLGTPNDYEMLSKKVDRLLEFDDDNGTIKKWYDLLKPVVNELVNASKGRHNPDFWARVCSRHGGGSGPSYLSGWVTAFCVFDENGQYQGDCKNINTWGKSETTEFCFIESGDIPVGLVSVPVTVDDNGEEHKTVMFAGSFAMNLVDPTTLEPRLDWCISTIDEEKVNKSKEEF